MVHISLTLCNRSSFCNQEATIFMFCESYREHIPFMHTKVCIRFIQELPAECGTIFDYSFQADPYDFRDVFLIFHEQDHGYIIKKPWGPESIEIHPASNRL